MELKRYFATNYLTDREGNVYSDYNNNLKKLNYTEIVEMPKKKRVSIGRMVLCCWEYRVDYIYKKCKHIDGDKSNNKLENLKWI